MTIQNVRPANTHSNFWTLPASVFRQTWAYAINTSATVQHATAPGKTRTAWSVPRTTLKSTTQSVLRTPSVCRTILQHLTAKSAISPIRWPAASAKTATSKTRKVTAQSPPTYPACKVSFSTRTIAWLAIIRRTWLAGLATQHSSWTPADSVCTECLKCVTRISPTVRNALAAI